MITMNIILESNLMQYLLPIYLPMCGIASVGQPGRLQEFDRFSYDFQIDSPT